jgi:peptide-methionine (S)-S-oxide reductase
VGYAGGTTENPTYYNLGDHSETVQLEYDPSQLSYQELLDIFWESHNPVYPAVSRQYRSIIFYHNDAQRTLALASKEHEEAVTGSEVFTEVMPAAEFYLAEDYHQKYYLRQVPELMEELAAIYPDPADLVASTAAARINGYLGGNGTIAKLQEQIALLGLSPEGKQRLLEIASRRLGGAVCSLK